MPDRDLVVIGASAGGVEAISQLATGLPRDLPACVVVVLHLPAAFESWLPQIVGRASPLPARHVENGHAVEPGQILIAPPDRHVLIVDGRLRTVAGPRQNRARPAVDPLFNSAAVGYRSRTIGIVLTGALDDGAAGLLAVKRCGGVAVVQSPDDASVPDMPRHALERVDADHVVPLAAMPELIERLVGEPADAAPAIPRDVLTDVRMTQRVMGVSNGFGELDQPVGPKSFSCPSCGGPLNEIEGAGTSRFRCRVGHTFTVRTLVAEQEETVEAALWAALETLEERFEMLERLARSEEGRGRGGNAGQFSARAGETRRHADRIRDLLIAES